MKLVYNTSVIDWRAWIIIRSIQFGGVDGDTRLRLFQHVCQKRSERHTQLRRRFLCGSYRLEPAAQFEREGRKGGRGWGWEQIEGEGVKKEIKTTRGFEEEKKTHAIPYTQRRTHIFSLLMLTIKMKCNRCNCTLRIALFTIVFCCCCCCCCFRLVGCARVSMLHKKTHSTLNQLYRDMDNVYAWKMSI